jgi:hypothetical protein
VFPRSVTRWLAETSGKIYWWDLSGLCSPTHYTHNETDRINPVTSFAFNICGLSDVQCVEEGVGPGYPKYGVAVQQWQGGCAIAGEGHPLFLPVDITNPLTGGINVTHDGAPYSEGENCGQDINGVDIVRSVTYKILCDPNVPTLEVDYAIEESKCQYVIEMRSKAGCSVIHTDNGGNCGNPSLPPYLNDACSTAYLGAYATLGPPRNNYYGANAACLRQCDPGVAKTCSATCTTGAEAFNTACQASQGSLYELTYAVTFEPAQPGGTKPQFTLQTLECLPQTCQTADQIKLFQEYSELGFCGQQSAGAVAFSCNVAVSAYTVASPTPTAKPTPGVTPSTTPLSPVPSRNPNASPSPSPGASTGGDGGAVGAVFATIAGLAIFGFGGYHLSTRMGWVDRRSVNPRVRNVMECGCCPESVARYLPGRQAAVVDRVAFTSSAGTGTGFGSSAASTSAGASSMPPARSAGSGYQTI